MPDNYKLIFALTHHNLFGFLVEAYRIILLKSGQWSMDIKRICDADSQFLPFGISEKEHEVLHMIFELREDKVLEHFHLLREKKVQTNGTFYSDACISKHIIPFISSRTASVINFFADSQIPLYFKSGESFSTFGDDSLQMEEFVAEPRFSFSLNESGFQYKLSVFLNDTQISLADSEIITQKPCFIKFKNKIISLPEDFDGQLLKPFTKQEEISVPKEKINNYLQTFVSKIIRKYRAEVSGFSVEEFSPGVNPVISISKLQRKMPVIELLFNYDGEQFSAVSSQSFTLKLLSSDSSISFVKTYRNRDAENEIIKSFESLGFHMIQPGYFTCLFCENEERIATIRQLLAELSAKSVALKKMGAKFDITVDSKRYMIEQPEIFTSISGVNDWFDLKMNIQFNGFTVPFQKIIPNIIKGDNEFKLPDGTIAFLPEEWFSRFKDVAVLSEQGEQGLKIHKSQVSLIENLENNFTDKLSEKLSLLIKREIPYLSVPQKLQATLRDYQKKGYEWLCYLHECGLGGCLADDMGLGKTIQMLTYFLKLSENPPAIQSESVNGSSCMKVSEKNKERRAQTHLIVCPLSLIHNWQEEIRKFAPSLKVIVYSGPDRYRLYHYFSYADIILSSYGIIRNDSDVLKHFDFHTIVLDESQFIKNPESKSYDSLLTLSSKQRFVLSGTPLENSLIDIWTQMNFLNPGMLGSLKAFRDTYVIPVEKNNDEQVSKRVQKLIGSFIMRRTKSEVTPELPPLTEKMCYCTMTEEQKSLYEKKKSEIRNYLIENSGSLSGNRRNIIVLSGLMKLRLIANHPSLSDVSYSGKSGKFDEICQHIEKAVAEGNKTIVFSQFVKHLNLVRHYLDQRGVSYEMLTGKTTQADRRKNINNFQNNDNVSLFLMTLKAGGVGLNLTQADYVFVLDPWWNPAAELQGINRTHRIGQDKKVFAYRFISAQTIEEKILLLQKKKSDLFENFINSASFGKLTDEELMTLFE
jgi:superfamily II DNA or RNA helicase